MSETLQLAESLISRVSISPNDAGCQQLLTERLTKLGFKTETLVFGDVTNLWAVHGSDGPLFIFAGHTDVVPPGPENEWTSPPFTPTQRDGHLYGRGAADMKTSVAAFVTACERFIEMHPNHKGKIALLITSDEEAVAIDGTRRVVEYLSEKNINVDWCLIGEASSEKQFGDTIKIGRRGTLNGELTIYGKQGHIAYPQLAENPIHKSFTALNEIVEHEWDKGNEHFQPTSFQFSNIHAGTGANNVIPGHLIAQFNLRFAPVTTPEKIQQTIESILNRHQLNYKINWHLSGDPFYTKPAELSEALTQSIKEITELSPVLSTAGGTSDGRFIAKMDCQVVEFGPINESIHQIDENIAINDIERLSQVYERVLEILLS